MKINPIPVFLSDNRDRMMLKQMIQHKAERYEAIVKARTSFIESAVYPDVQGGIRPYFITKIFDELKDGREIPDLERELRNMCYWLNKSENRIRENEDWQRAYDHATKDIKIDRVVAGLLGVSNFNRNLKCPFHEDKGPSLKVYTKSNYFVCFGCEARGSPIDFVMRYKNCDFKEAVKLLAHY